LANPALIIAVLLTIISMLDYFRGFWGSGDTGKSRKEMDVIELPDAGKRSAARRP
jgi:hypothetical protein